MARIYIPTASADQWASLLAEPEKQWAVGYSARTLAHAWQDAGGFPSEVATTLSTSDELAGAELLAAFPEHQVALPGGRRPSQSDIWILAKAGGKLVSIAVEGKVAEPFGPTVGEWLTDASPGKQARLSFLQEELGLLAPPPSAIRYQLLHRAASSMIEAKRFGAAHAVLLIHSFSQTHQWFEDYAAFAALFGAGVAVGRVAAAGRRNGILLHLAWACGDPVYLRR